MATPRNKSITIASRKRPILPPQEGEVPSILDQLAAYRGSLMTAAQLAPILGISDDLLYAMVRRGDIPVFIVPGTRTRRFEPASIDFWIRKHNPILNQVKKAS